MPCVPSGGHPALKGHTAARHGASLQVGRVAVLSPPPPVLGTAALWCDLPLAEGALLWLLDSTAPPQSAAGPQSLLPLPGHLMTCRSASSPECSHTGRRAEGVLTGRHVGVTTHHPLPSACEARVVRNQGVGTGRGGGGTVGALWGGAWPLHGGELPVPGGVPAWQGPPGYRETSALVPAEPSPWRLPV